MAVTWDRGTGAPQGGLVADRNLYLDKSGNKLVEEGDAESGSQLVAAGHPINSADAGRLGLSMKGDKIVQDRPAQIAEYRKLFADLEGEKKAFYDKVEQYRRENAVKDIPNTMEADRVALETRWEHANMALAQAIKAEEGKDPLLGESQATSVKPEKSEIAKAASKQAKAAVAASPSPQRLAANAPSARAETAPASKPAPPARVATSARSAPAAGKASGKKGRGK